MSRSNNLKDGAARAPHRSLLKGLGFISEEMDRPIIGIANSFNEIIPGHVHLQTLVQAVKDGIRNAGGVPMEFNTIGICDGLAMNHIGMKYSLVTRQLIADSVEAVAMATPFDAIVFIPNCDKVVPGMLMAAARLNIPSIFISGGAMLAGVYKGKKVGLSNVFEAVGQYEAGLITRKELNTVEDLACPTCGSCAGMYTANTMNCLTEALGMGLPGNGTVPAVFSERLRLAKKAGMQILEVLKADLRPSDIMTKKAFENAVAVDMALGGSSNTALHLPAIAHEAGVDLTLDDFNEIAKKTPQLCKLSPSGEYFIEDLYRAGGVTGVMKRLYENGRLNAEVVGKSAYIIAQMAGLEIPHTAKVLIGEVESTGMEEPFAHEKLSPVLAMYRSENFKDALDKAETLVELGGLGHTSALYVNLAEREKIDEFGRKMKTGRTLINMPASLGAIGDVFNFKLEPSLTLGCGSWGGNSVSENIGVKHLINVKTIAERRENMLWFKVPQKVYFKYGSLPTALEELKGEHKKAFIVTDSVLAELGYTDHITKVLEEIGIDFRIFSDVKADPLLSSRGSKSYA